MQESKEIKHKREVKLIDLFLYFYLTLIIILILIAFCITNIILKYIPIKWYFTLLISLVLIYYPLRKLAIGCVLMYKAYAPMQTRNRCRYQPSCSTYMIIALQRYGIILGIILGIKRIKSCVPPNGGVDFPSLSKLKRRKVEL